MLCCSVIKLIIKVVCGCAVLQLSAASRRDVRPDELSASELVVTSAFSKMVASTITYPHEVVRSYMHVTGEGGGGRLHRGLLSAAIPV